MKKTFNHPFKSPLSDDEIQQVFGYQKALNALYIQIAQMTEWKPENRFIDSSILCEMIGETLGELIPLFEEKQAELLQAAK